MSATRPSTAGHGLLLPAAVAAEIRAALPGVADDVVAAIIEEVPSYTDAFSGPMGETIRNAVQIALGGFLSLATGRRGADPRTPTAPAVEGAYQLGRGEARSGRSTDALLSAYRIGARVSWQQMAAGAVRAGLDAETLASFAELVFAYIDELSAASVAGHTDELATTGRVRQRRLERLAHHLLTGAAPRAVAGRRRARRLGAAAHPDRGDRARVAGAAGARRGLRRAPCRPPTRPGSTTASLLLVPDAHGRRRGPRCCARSPTAAAIAGPARPWLEVRASYDRALRARASGSPATPRRTCRSSCSPPTPRRWPTCARGRSPRSTSLRPATADKLAETLRPGCCSRAGATRSPRRCSCTRRPCATGWASCARPSATASTTPRWCSR